MTTRKNKPGAGGYRQGSGAQKHPDTLDKKVVGFKVERTVSEIVKELVRPIIKQLEEEQLKKISHENKVLNHFKFNIQTSSVATHIDFRNKEEDEELFMNNNENEPCGFRILLQGRRENCLYMKNDRYGKKIYCTMPDDTDVYVLRHTDGWHGTEEDLDRQTMFLHIEVDPEKHQELLAKSLTKYGKYAVYAPSLPEFNK